MNGEKLIDRAVRLIRDPDVTRDLILEVLNEGLVEVTGKLRIPYLGMTAEVDTVPGESETALPEEYQFGLYDCQDIAKDMPVTVLNSKKQLLANYGRLTYTGDVKHVCAVGDTLVYNPIPTEATTLQLSFYRLPDQITERTEPVCLKGQFHLVLVHYAANYFYVPIEDGVDGETVNTDKYENAYNKMIEEMKLFYKEGQSFPPPPVTVGEYL